MKKPYIILDEASILIGAGINGRGGMAAIFDGLPMERPVTPLKLTNVQCTAVFKRCSLAAICCKVDGGMKNDFTGT